MVMVTPDGVEIVLVAPTPEVGVPDGAWVMAPTPVVGVPAAELTLDADDAVPGITV